MIVARNYTVPPIKGETDLVGWDGPVLASVEVKTRTPAGTSRGRPEDAVDLKKRQHRSRIARRGRRPEVRLHKHAFAGSGEVP